MQFLSHKRSALFLFMLLVVSVLVMALWQYHQMVVAVYDGASASVFRRMTRPFSVPEDALGRKPVRIGILHSIAVSDTGDQIVDNTGERARQWERILGRLGFSSRRISEPRGMADLAPYNLLVVPGGTALSDNAVVLIKNFVRQGNGVIMSWAAGSRDEQGRWRESDLLRKIAGLELGEAVPDGTDTGRVQVKLNPGSPLTLGIEPGFILSLTRFDRPLAALARERRTEVVGTWIEGGVPATLAPDVVGTDVKDRTVIACGDYFAGRFVWMGYTVDSSAPETEQQRVFGSLLHNAVAWVTRQPIAYKSDWPANYSSAFNLAWRMEHAEDFDGRVLTLAESYRMPISSYVTPEFLAQEREKTLLLVAAGNVGLLMPGAAGEAADAVVPPLEVLREWRRQLAALNGEKPVGCLLPFASAPADWLDRLAKAGFDYVVSPDVMHLLPRLVRSHRRIPVFARAHELWLIPDTPAFGNIYLDDAGTPVAGSMERRFEDIDVRGGLLHLSFSALHVDDPFLEALDRLLAQIKRRRVWTAGSIDVLEYYRSWGHLRVSTEYPTPHRYVIQVSNTGTRSLYDVTVFVALAEKGGALDITPTTLGTPPVRPVVHDGKTWRFDIQRIRPGKNFVYHAYHIR